MDQWPNHSVLILKLKPRTESHLMSAQPAPGGGSAPRVKSDASSSRSWVGDRGAILVLMGALFIAFLPLWWTYFSWRMQDGHYRHLPLLWIAVGFLYYQRLPQAKQDRTPSSPILVGLGLASVAVIVLCAHLAFSGFLGVIGTVVALWVFTYAWFGMGGASVLLPVLVLSILAIPLPLNWDRKLVFELQFVASRLASLLLDGAAVMHVREGVVLITEKSQFMTEEACSGIRSLFSSLTVVAVYAVASGHRLGRLLSNLIATVPWVLVGNAIRIALCVVLADNFDPGWADGPKHELLSLLGVRFHFSDGSQHRWSAESLLAQLWSNSRGSAKLRFSMRAIPNHPSWKQSRGGDRRTRPLTMSVRIM